MAYLKTLLVVLRAFDYFVNWRPEFWRDKCLVKNAIGGFTDKCSFRKQGARILKGLKRI